MPFSLLGQYRLMGLFSLHYKCINKGVLFDHITVLTLRIQSSVDAASDHGLPCLILIQDFCTHLFVHVVK